MPRAKRLRLLVLKRFHPPKGPAAAGRGALVEILERAQDPASDALLPAGATPSRLGLRAGQQVRKAGRPERTSGA